MKVKDKFRVSAPTRADLAGGTLDLWPLYCLVGSASTINVALDLMAQVDCEVLESDVCKVELRGHQGATALFYEPVFGEALKNLPPALQFPAFLISQYLSQQPHLPELHLKISLQTAAPQGSGLGGSSTLCVALARALNRVFGHFQEQGWQWKVLDWVRDAEARFLKTPTGTQDYLAALFGSVQTYRYSVGGISVDPYSPEVFKGISDRALVVFSGEQHHSGISNFELFKKAFDGDAQVLSGLSEIKAIADQMDDALRSSEIDWDWVGRLLSEEWKVRRHTFQVHTPTLDKLVANLQRPGVLGVKVCGAAQGGSLLVFAEPDKKATLLQTLVAEGISVLPARAYLLGVLTQDLP